MSRILDVSNKLGEYLLQGYILTDEPCPTCLIPMLRTPAHSRQPQLLFCSQCSDLVPEANEHQLVSSDNNVDKNVLNMDIPQTSSEPESPTLSQPFDNPEILRRRLQSDRASAEIGSRMLKGWAMLAEECPNESCYGIPLVRPPKSGAVKDKSMECVVCGGIYVHERTASGQFILTKQNQSLTTVITPGASKSIYTNVSPSSFAEDYKASHEIPSNLQHSANKILHDASAAGQHASVNAKTPLISTISITIAALQDSLQVNWPIPLDKYRQHWRSSLHYTCTTKKAAVVIKTRVYQHSMSINKIHEANEPLPGCYLIVKGLLRSFKNMPRFLSPFRRRDREGEHIDSHPGYYDNYQYLRSATPSGDSQRNSFSPKHRHRDVVYANVNERAEDYVIPSSNIESYPGALTGRRNRADGYSDTSFTDSDVRYARHRSRTPHTHVSDPTPYVERLTSQESYHALPSQARPYPVQGSPERPPTPVYRNSLSTPVPRDQELDLSHIQEMPAISEEPRRIYAKPGESITINGVQIEFQGNERRTRHHGGHNKRAHSKARYTDGYASDGYATSSEFEDQPIIIKADPRTEIQIGNDRDGYIPYQHYYTPDKRRHHKGRSHHRRDHDPEEVYIVPAGANVIFVDEDGRELHRVGDFDEDRYSRRRNSRVHANRQADGSYVIDL